MGGIKMIDAIFILIIILSSIIISIIIIDVTIEKFYEFKAKRDRKRFEKFVSSMKLKGVKYNPDGTVL